MKNEELEVDMYTMVYKRDEQGVIGQNTLI